MERLGNPCAYETGLFRLPQQRNDMAVVLERCAGFLVSPGRDVDEGRRALNLSEWNRPQKEANESAKTVEKGEMPPRFYVAVHPEARLEPSQREALIRGLQANRNPSCRVAVGTATCNRGRPAPESASLA